ncbi:multidrug resistance protein 1, partial [Clonorchis sinensis]
RLYLSVHASFRKKDSNSRYILFFHCFVIRSRRLFPSSVRNSHQTETRQPFSKAILRQDVPWFEKQTSGGLVHKLSENVDIIQNGIGTKFGDFVQNISGFLTGLIIAFAVGWKLSLVAFAMLPLVAIAFALFGFLMKILTLKEVAAYSRAGGIANEVLSAIRTVVAFGGEEKEYNRYSSELTTAQKQGVKKSMAVGGVMGLIGLTLFTSAAVVFWYGVELMLIAEYTAGTVVAVFFNVILGSIYLGNALPALQYFLTATTVARDVYDTIERTPSIDKNYAGTVHEDFHGNINFQDIKFVYPTRPDTTVLQEFNMNLRKGQTVALVGPSGSGKSTVVHMLQRFYEPIEGRILVEGTDIRELDLKAFRSQQGFVQQEPILFEGTVAENIRLGKLDADQAEIEEAARLANAHDFILSLPEGYNTVVGERGTGMSGGQKQRIAIARALIRKPRLLLLDEATSALDTNSERIVQAALDKASTGRTVVMVAHRLTTVRNADLILVLENGRIREAGTHDQLTALDGLYSAMLLNQKRSRHQDSTDEDADADLKHMEPEVWKVEDEEVIRLTKCWNHFQRSWRFFSLWYVFCCLQLKQIKRSPLARMLRMNRPELAFIVLGCLCSAVSGATQPVFAILYSQLFEIFTLVNNPPLMREQVRLISGLMALVGGLRFLGTLGEGYFFGVSGERLTQRLRSQLFKAILSQDIGWFDRQENQPGILTARLATEASKLKVLSGSSLGFIVEAGVLSIISIVVAFIYSWQLALLVLGFAPILVLSGMLQVKRMQGGGGASVSLFAMKIAQEALSAEKTVFAFNLEDYFYKRFKNALQSNLKSELKDNLVNSLVFALTQSIMMFCFAASMSLGAYLLNQNSLTLVGLFRQAVRVPVFIVLNMSSQSLGRTASVVPELTAASKAAKSIFSTMDRIPHILTDAGEKPTEQFTGQVEFKNVTFTYPNRPGTRILKRFSHCISAGESVALVGVSGCGKSTLLQLVQRFYDPIHTGPDSGVFFDGHNLRSLAPSWIRRQIGIVSQEPNLFDLSIRENIAYGDNSKEVSMEEIIEAARQANIHDFVCTLPQGYDTQVGARGGKLSGGQKQRVAIARALIRKPALLLLDEATSALDNESERIVQQALDGIVGTCTSIVVAHRLTTVENVDKIVVMENGRKIEDVNESSVKENHLPVVQTVAQFSRFRMRAIIDVFCHKDLLELDIRWRVFQDKVYTITRAHFKHVLSTEKRRAYLNDSEERKTNVGRRNVHQRTLCKVYAARDLAGRLWLSGYKQFVSALSAWGATDGTQSIKHPEILRMATSIRRILGCQRLLRSHSQPIRTRLYAAGGSDELG